MEIDYLREFLVLADTKNYWRAAERLYMNQSTLSKHIKAMEEELGKPLFDRTARPVRLSEYGQLLLPYAQAIVRLQYEYASAFLRHESSKKNSITISCMAATAQYHFIDLLIDFQRENPGCDLQVIENDSYQSLQMLGERRCALIFCRDFPGAHTLVRDQALETIPFVTDHLVAVVGKGHPMAGRGTVSLRELQGEQFCFVKNGSYLYDLCRSACQEAGFISNVVFDSERLENILSYTADGRHTALLMGAPARYAFENSLPFRQSLDILDLAPAITSRLSICYLRDVPLSPAAQALVSYLQARISPTA